MAAKPPYSSDTMGDKLLVDTAADNFRYGLVTGMVILLVMQLIPEGFMLLRESNLTYKPIHMDLDASTPDAATESLKASTSAIQIRDVMQNDQQLYCINPVPELTRTFGSVQVLQHVTLYGPVDDYDLKYLQNIAAIESHLLDEMIWAIGQYRASTTAELKKPLVLDIGANIGWVTANAVKAGARVAAFEARPSMIQGLRKTLCSSPWMMESVVLYPMQLGLGTEDCIYINLDFVGYASDSSVVCAKEPGAVFGVPIGAVRVTRLAQYTSGAQLVVSSLDKLFDEHIQVMKVHLDGSRSLVLEGADALLRQGLVSYIILRVEEPMRQLTGKDQVLSFLRADKYACSFFGFQGPPIHDLDDFSPSSLPQNVYCSLTRAAESVKDVPPISLRSRKAM